ncbi:MAG: lysostaphin resistance A-like protein, partial [Ruminococcus sp.]
AVAYLFIVFFLNDISSVITSLISDIMNQCGFQMYNINDYTNYQSTPAKISDFIYGVLVAPVTEEFFYRGMVLKNLSKASQRCGIFMSALIFGLMHMTVPQIVLGFIMGIFLAHITIKHNSIIPAIIAHSFNNSLGYILSPLGNATSDFGIIIANSVYYVMLMFGLFALIGFKMTNKLPHDTPHQSRRGIQLVFLSVPVIIAIVYYILKTISYILRIS